MYSIGLRCIPKYKKLRAKGAEPECMGTTPAAYLILDRASLTALIRPVEE